MTHKLLAASKFLLAVTMIGICGVALSSDKNDDQGLVDQWFGGVGAGVVPVNNPQYAEECGACHFPYQPGLLPARSWDRLIDTLSNHFGENAELPSEDAMAIRDYLLNNAADKSGYTRALSRKMMKSLRPSMVPARISSMPYFIEKHSEIPNIMVEDNSQIGSFSNCDSCHKQAAKGSFDKGEILVPGFCCWGN